MPDSLVADEVNGAAHVDVHKVHTQVLIQQLGAAPHGIWETTADLRIQAMSALGLGKPGEACKSPDHR